MLLRSPGFTAAAVVCLGLGVGATTAIFSIVNAVLLRPLPYADSQRLVRIYSEFPTAANGGTRRFWVSPPEYFDIKRETKSWDTVEAWLNAGVNLSGEHEPVRATASYVTGGLLPALGVKPVMGRLITPQDDTPNAPSVAVLSNALWHNAYGGDPHILSRDIRLNGRPCTVIGVMPKSFEFPPGEVDRTELWAPLGIDPAHPGNRPAHFLSSLGRLKANVTIEQARDDAKAFVQRSGESAAANVHNFRPNQHIVVLAGFQDDVVRSVHLAMIVVLAAAGFVLLIATVNVANLLLARSEARRREVAIRKAIGAGLGRLVAQFLTEGVLLSAAGALLGLIVALLGLRLIVNTNAGSIPRMGEIDVDWRVLLGTVVISLATGIAFGLAPVMHLTGQNVNETLKAAAGRVSGSARAGRFRAALVISELALALVLLIGTGLMIKAFWKLQEVNTGLRTENVLTARIALPRTTYPNGQNIAAFWSTLEAKLAGVPGATAVAVAGGLPPLRPVDANSTEIEGVPKPLDGLDTTVDFWNQVSPSYFKTMGVPLIEGRYFDERDGAAAPPVVIVNQTMARQFWGNRSALGRRVRPGYDGPWRTVVGLVADVKNAGLDRPAGSELYIPYEQHLGYLGRTATVIVRTANDPRQFVNTLRSGVREIDPALPLSAVRSMDEVMAAARSRPLFLTMLLSLFSGVSLTLAALGIYGVISYAVAQRTNEIGLRMALGAQKRDILAMMLGQGVRLSAIGTVAGAAGAFALTRFLRGLLFGVSSFDVATFVVMAAVLGAVTLLACYVPARRAAKVDPMIALRYD